jgi:hypothetical protein
MAVAKKFFIENAAPVAIYVLVRVRSRTLHIRVSDTPRAQAQKLEPGQKIGYDIVGPIKSCFSGTSASVDYRRSWNGPTPPPRMIFNAARVEGAGPVHRITSIPN